MITTQDIKELITLIRHEVSSVKTCFGCEIVGVSLLRKDRVSIKLSARDTKEFDFPTVLDVPVKFFKFGKSIIYAPPAIGDKGIVVMSSKSTQQFKNPTNISFNTMFDIDNSFYIGGCFVNADDTSMLGDNLLIKHGNDIIELKDEEIVLTSTKVTVNAPTVSINATSVNLGVGGQPIARVGDSVQVGGVPGTITSGGISTSI